MATTIGIVVFTVGMIARIGQNPALLATAWAVKLGALKPAKEIDPVLRVVEARAVR
jgi:hypothetical protein